jgi:UDP-3-O-[3-hydroxymyristoyl] glucosamine N-acyltransferase
LALFGQVDYDSLPARRAPLVHFGSRQMSITLKQIADLVDGTLHGPGDLVVSGAATIRDALPGQITLAEGEKALKQLATCKAAAVIVGKLPAPPEIPYIQVDNLHGAFAKVVQHFRPRRTRAPIGISPAAHISPSAQIGENVTIRAGAIIGDEVLIERDCVIHSGVVIEAGCRIGAGTTIFSNAVLYEDTIVGEQCIVHSGAVLGAYGFGYSLVNGRHELSAQLGYVELGPRVEIGAGTTIDRGTYGATVIGEGTKIDNQVMIGHNCRIGRHNLICSQVGIAGSTTTGDYVVMGGQVGIRDHVHIGDRVMLGAMTGVMNDILQPGNYVGAPATPEREYFACLFGFARLPEMRKQLKQLERDVAQLKSESGPSVARSDAA